MELPAQRPRPRLGHNPLPVQHPRPGWQLLSHFCGRTPTGRTALKRRQLRAAGWALLPVPYWEWDVLGSKGAKQEYLLAALNILHGGEGSSVPHSLPEALQHALQA